MVALVSLVPLEPQYFDYEVCSMHYPYRLSRLIVDLLIINRDYRCPVGSRGPDRASVTAEERKVLEQSGKTFEE
jgi:hypothetical protein